MFLRLHCCGVTSIFYQRARPNGSTANTSITRTEHSHAAASSSSGRPPFLLPSVPCPPPHPPPLPSPPARRRLSPSTVVVPTLRRRRQACQEGRPGAPVGLIGPQLAPPAVEQQMRRRAGAGDDGSIQYRTTLRYVLFDGGNNKLSATPAARGADRSRTRWERAVDLDTV